MNKFQEVLKNWETPFNKQTNEAWSELQPKLVSQKNETKVIGIRRSPWVAAAASVAVLFAIYMFWPKSKLIRRETTMAQTLHVDLPDHSKAILNAASSISFEDEWSNERSLKLDGEAFFEVQKGSRFSVNTDEGVVEVLGTSFDVFSRNDDFKVECRTGRVKVSLNNGKSAVEITPGQVASLKSGNLIVADFDLNSSDWQTGEFSYHDEPLQNVFDEISRQFNVKIQSNVKSERFYTGGFSNKNLSKALELVCVPMGLSFEVRGDNQVVITEIGR